ncbi:MAG: hypothetical protein GTN65_04835, partial [Armatimonadetes bacterium]|nr:hypothetical protein [Armatimonadota bacterium]NIO96423.1 hypothetical protein [Armatimonadota bacterium]
EVVEPALETEEEAEAAEEFIAQAEAIVEAAEVKAKDEKKVEELEEPEEVLEEPELESQVEQPPPEPVKPQPPVSKVAPPSDGKEPMDRAERAVEILRRALIAALSELGGVDTKDLQIPAAPSAPQAVEAPPAEAPPVEPEIRPTPAIEEVKRVEIKPDEPWIGPDTKTEILKEKWSGAVREVTIGATAEEGGTRTHTVTVGGETAMPFMHFEGSIPYPPAIAIEIHDRKP